MTTIPRILQKDLSKLSEAERRDAFAIIKLTTSSDLATLQNKAQNRSGWRRGVEKIVAAAVADWRDRQGYRKERQANVAAMRGTERNAPANTRPVTRRQTTLNEHFLIR